METLNNPTRKLYTVHQVFVSTFLGSAIAGGWFATQNAKRLGQKNTSVYLIFSVLYILALGVISVLFPIPKEFPNLIIPMITALIVRQIVEVKQGTQIKECIASGETAESWWKVLGISLICFIIALIIMGAIFFTLPKLIS